MRRHCRVAPGAIALRPIWTLHGTSMTKTSAGIKVALPLLACLTLPVVAFAAPERIAIFPFELDDTSLQGSSADDLARVHRLDEQLASALTATGRYAPVDLRALAPQIAAQSLRVCDACAVALAHQAGAEVEVNGWVQKVSPLILNINLVIRDAASGRMLHAGSVDIRGDTDESWQRGLAWLLEHRILSAAP